MGGVGVLKDSITIYSTTPCHHVPISHPDVVVTDHSCGCFRPPEVSRFWFDFISCCRHVRD